MPQPRNTNTNRVMVQIPPDLKKELAKRADEIGISLSALILLTLKNSTIVRNTKNDPANANDTHRPDPLRGIS